jgi:hypothetical protein
MCQRCARLLASDTSLVSLRCLLLRGRFWVGWMPWVRLFTVISSHLTQVFLVCSQIVSVLSSGAADGEP